MRKEPLPTPYLGATVMGHEELGLLAEVIHRKAPFRAYGINAPHMVDDFEKELRQYFNKTFALATATGSGSLYAAMAGLGLGPGDEVIIPSFSWYTDFEAPALVGATPVFADIDRSLCLDPDDVERKLSPNTKAIVVVHFQGASHGLKRLVEIAQRYGIKLVEDCAQAFGATMGNQKLGTFGDVACFSLQQNKIITTGDGGALVTDDPLIFERAVRFHDLGNVRPTHKEQLVGGLVSQPFSGCQFRMNEFTGAVALAQLRKIERQILDVTRRFHRQLRNRLTIECPGLTLRPVDDVDGDAGIAFYMDLLTGQRARRLIETLSAEGIRVGPSSSCKNLLHDTLVKTKQLVHPALPPFGLGWPGERTVYSPDLCPRTDAILESMVCVALSPAYSEQDVDDIANAIVKVWRPVLEYDTSA